MRAHVADKKNGEKSGVGETSFALTRVRGLLLRTIDRNLRTISSAACSFGTTAGSGTFTSTSLAAPAPVFFRMDMGVVVGTRAAARVSAENARLVLGTLSRALLLSALVFSHRIGENGDARGRMRPANGR